MSLGPLDFLALPPLRLPKVILRDSPDDFDFAMVYFLSADFNRHPVAYFLLDFISELYKSNKFKLFAFSNSNIEDHYTKKLKLNLNASSSLGSIHNGNTSHVSRGFASLVT